VTEVTVGGDRGHRLNSLYAQDSWCVVDLTFARIKSAFEYEQLTARDVTLFYKKECQGKKLLPRLEGAKKFGSEWEFVEAQ
jgi:hypothetical protein